MDAVLEVPPFDALPGEMGQTLAGMLRPVELRRGESILNPEDEPSGAHIVLEGELDFEIAGKQGGTFGPRTLIGVLALFVSGLSGLGTIRASSDARCLSLTREDVDHLRALSPEFDKECRNLAVERTGQLEHHPLPRELAPDKADTSGPRLRLPSCGLPGTTAFQRGLTVLQAASKNKAAYLAQKRFIEFSSRRSGTGKGVVLIDAIPAFAEDRRWKRPDFLPRRAAGPDSGSVGTRAWISPTG